MVHRIVTSWTGTLGALFIVLAWWAAHLFPTSGYWFETFGMVVPDAVVGADVILFVDREVHRPVYGEWTVTVRRQGDNGWSLFCTARGESDYVPIAVLPAPLTLDWWTNDLCPPLMQGTYFITTTWTFTPNWLPGVRRSPPLLSNSFQVLELAQR